MAGGEKLRLVWLSGTIFFPKYKEKAKFQWEMFILGTFSTAGLLFVVGRGCSYVVLVK